MKANDMTANNNNNPKPAKKTPARLAAEIDAKLNLLAGGHRVSDEDAEALAAAVDAMLTAPPVQRRAYSKAEVCQMVGISVPTFNRYARKGLAPVGVEMFGVVRYTQQAIDDFEASRPKKGQHTAPPRRPLVVVNAQRNPNDGRRTRKPKAAKSDDSSEDAPKRRPSVFDPPGTQYDRRPRVFISHNLAPLR